MTDFNDADEAKEHLLDALARHRNVNGGGLAKDEHGWYIKLNLTNPHKWWHRKLPTRFEGFRVKTQVIGTIYAL